MKYWNNGLEATALSIVCIGLRIEPNVQQGWLRYGGKYRGQDGHKLIWFEDSRPTLHVFASFEEIQSA
jgi:hypothetical protein